MFSQINLLPTQSGAHPPRKTPLTQVDPKEYEERQILKRRRVFIFKYSKDKESKNESQVKIHRF